MHVYLRQYQLTSSHPSATICLMLFFTRVDPTEMGGIVCVCVGGGGGGRGGGEGEPSKHSKPQTEPKVSSI